LLFTTAVTRGHKVSQAEQNFSKDKISLSGMSVYFKRQPQTFLSVKHLSAKTQLRQSILSAVYRHSSIQNWP